MSGQECSRPFGPCSQASHPGPAWWHHSPCLRSSYPERRSEFPSVPTTQVLGAGGGWQPSEGCLQSSGAWPQTGAGTLPCLWPTSICTVGFEAYRRTPMFVPCTLPVLTPAAAGTFWTTVSSSSGSPSPDLPLHLQWMENSSVHTASAGRVKQ